MAAEIADIAGEDARQAVIDAVIERNEGTRKGPVLREILGKALAAGVAGMLVFSYSADSPAATVSIAEADIRSEPLIHRIFYRLGLMVRRALAEAGRAGRAALASCAASFSAVRPIPAAHAHKVWERYRAMFCKHERPACWPDRRASRMATAGA